MATPSAVLSHTLQALTTVKFDETKKQRELHAERQDQLFNEVDAIESQHLRIETLFNAIHDPSNDVHLPHVVAGSYQADQKIEKLLELSKHDASVPPKLLDTFEATLRNAWAAKSRSFDFAALYATLLREWIDPPTSTIDTVPADTPKVRETDEDFQMVERDRLQQLCSKFENVVFAPLETDAGEIEVFLQSIFDNEDAIKTLNILRKSTRMYGDELMENREPFQTHVVRNCIKGLMGEALLKDEKKTTLQEFEKNETVLIEIADVLNLRFNDLANWTWNAPNGLPVEPRRQLNGKWRIMADEDILQAIFLHYIAMHWASHFKQEFSKMADSSSSRSKGVWKQGDSLSSDEIDRRQYFEGCALTGKGLQQTRNAEYQNLYLDNLPNDVYGILAPYDETFAESSDDSDESAPLKQKVLRRFATDILIQRELHDEVAALQGDMQWYAPSLPHATVIAIMKFFGMSREWLDFFCKYLEAPLNMQAGLEGGKGRVQIRKRGTPIASALAVFVGELVLMPLDLAVNHRSGLLLYRMHDDFWMSGPPEDVVTGWRTVETYVKTMGLQLNQPKCGSVYLTSGEQQPSIQKALPEGPVEVGFLRLNGESGKWEINQDSVTAHISQLRIQLSACTSVFAWVSTWNSCIGRFFNFSFAQPAAIFGRSHVDRILETHRRIQTELFRVNGGGVTRTVNEYLRHTLADRFKLNAQDIPDVFLFLPQKLGGLGLKNPFIPLVLLRNRLQGEPEDEIRRWRQLQRGEYKACRQAYDSLTERQRVQRLRDIYDGVTLAEGVPKADSAFPSFAEWCAHCTLTDGQLGQAYVNLLQLPNKEYEQMMKLPAGVDVNLSYDEQWVVEMYLQELDELFCSTRIVKQNLLPLGVLEMMNERTVGWSLQL